MPQSFLFAVSPKVGPIAKAPSLGTAHVLFPDLNESVPELRDSERVNDGIDGRVAVTEQDGNIEQAH